MPPRQVFSPFSWQCPLSPETFENWSWNHRDFFIAQSPRVFAKRLPCAFRARRACKSAHFVDEVEHGAARAPDRHQVPGSTCWSRLRFASCSVQALTVPSRSVAHQRIDPSRAQAAAGSVPVVCQAAARLPACSDKLRCPLQRFDAPLQRKEAVLAAASPGRRRQRTTTRIGEKLSQTIDLPSLAALWLDVGLAPTIFDVCANDRARIPSGGRWHAI